MSELRRIVREFGRQVNEAENRTAKTLAEVAGAIKITDQERRDRIMESLKRVKEGSDIIGAACLDIMAALDASEGDTGEIAAQVEGMKVLRLQDTGSPTLINGTEGETNG